MADPLQNHTGTTDRQHAQASVIMPPAWGTNNSAKAAMTPALVPVPLVVFLVVNDRASARE